MLDTKFDELMDFPCAFPFKVVGEAHETLTDKVVAVYKNMHRVIIHLRQKRRAKVAITPLLSA